MAKDMNNVIDLDLGITNKKKFRISGDNDRILELNTSDMDIVNRLNVIYPKLTNLCEKAGRSLDYGDSPTTEDDLKQLGNTISNTDAEMRKLIDELFDSNVSEVCAPYGTMIDIIDGTMRFEHLITTLSKLYENNFEKETKRMTDRMSKHTQKYTKKKHKKR